MEKIKLNGFIEDFDFVYESLMTYYPYFEVNKILHNIDWLGNKEIYSQRIAQCKTDTEFYKTMNHILSELNNGHTHLLPIEMGLYLYAFYKNLEEPNWRVDMVDIFKKLRVKERYEVTNENINKMQEAQTNYEPEENDSLNVIIGDIVVGKAGYLRVKNMNNPDMNAPSFKEEYIVIKDYLEKIKDYPALIIDIRGNGGGNSAYWSDFLIPLIVDKPYSQKTYSFIKEGQLLNSVISKGGYEEYTSEIQSSLNFPEETLDIIKEFSYVLSDTCKVEPHKDSINYKGKIYLLVDRKVYSSSEMMASFAKETKMATLVGERTGGDGIGSDPMIIDLPNSGYVLRFSKEIGITEKGSINELDQTEPDIIVSSPSIKVKFDSNGQVILNNDKAIMAIL